MHHVPGVAVRQVERARRAGAVGEGVARPIGRRVEMAIDVEIADASVLVKIGERAGARDRHRMIAAAQHDLGAAMQALGQIVDRCTRATLSLLPGTMGMSPQSTILKKVSEIDVVFEHVGEILRRGLANAGRALRGAGAHHLTLIPGNADEADLGAHGADGVAVRRAVGRAHEGGDALRLEGAVVQLRRIDVIVGSLVLMGPAMLMRHVLPASALLAHLVLPALLASRRRIGRDAGICGGHESDRNELHFSAGQHFRRGTPAIGAAEIVERCRRLHRVAIGAQHRERHLVDVQPRAFAERVARRRREAEMQRARDPAQHAHPQIDLRHARGTEAFCLLADLIDQSACDRHLMHGNAPLLAPAPRVPTR